MRFEREIGLMCSVIDRYFGTLNGYNVKTIMHTDGHTNKTADLEGPNIFSRMSELGLIICGGAVNSIFTNSPINDLDFYCMKRENQGAAIEFLKEFFPVESYTSRNAVTLLRNSKSSKKQYRVQLITRFYGIPSEIFDWFDFTITHGAFVVKDKFNYDFVLGDRFLPDLAERRLVYSGRSKYPICALYRTLKYADRGFKIPGSTLMHIALCIVQLKIENYGDLKEQLMGIDTMYLQDLLDSKNPETPVDYGVFVEDVFKRLNLVNGLSKAEEADNDA